MASSQQLINHIFDQLDGTGVVDMRKMFGAEVFYINDRPIVMSINDVVFVKKFPELESLMTSSEFYAPYPNAKDHYVLDIDNRPLVHDVVTESMALVPIPKSRQK
jgi:TfoX/Sxy family transcriptional regulator of competence genes